ncbi:hypothetical protein CBS101457_005324 [Exobasidium rhododendri]|nr:hypothetical protein CBS101457_005324 [Exobasidium rhododendri]
MSALIRRNLSSLQAIARTSPSSASAAAAATRTASTSTSSSSASTSATSSSSSSSSPPPLRSSSSSSTLVSHLQSSTLPLFTATNDHTKTLYDHLSSLPNNGVGTKVRQIRWAAKGIDQPFSKGKNAVGFQGPIKNPLDRKTQNHLCYWLITKARIRLAGEKRAPHGKVWGRLIWRGVPVTPEGKEERIRGGLKYSWDVAN